MSPLLHPYRVLLLAAISVSMLLFLKINKRSFYFHYFKVIEEVELRNSQALLTEAFPIQVWSQQLKEAVRNILPFLTGLLSLGLLLIHLPSQWILPKSRELVLIPVEEPHFLLPPVRAP